MVVAKHLEKRLPGFLDALGLIEKGDRLLSSVAELAHILIVKTLVAVRKNIVRPLAVLQKSSTGERRSRAAGGCHCGVGESFPEGVMDTPPGMPTSLLPWMLAQRLWARPLLTTVWLVAAPAAG